MQVIETKLEEQKPLEMTEYAVMMRQLELTPIVKKMSYQRSTSSYKMSIDMFRKIMKDKGWMDIKDIHKESTLSKTSCHAFLKDVLLNKYVEKRLILTFNNRKFQWRWIEEDDGM